MPENPGVAVKRAGRRTPSRPTWAAAIAEPAAARVPARSLFGKGHVSSAERPPQPQRRAVTAPAAAPEETPGTRVAKAGIGSACLPLRGGTGHRSVDSVGLL